MITINKQIELLADKFIKGEDFVLSDCNFTNIDEKKNALSDFLKISIDRIEYNLQRNLFIIDEIGEEYNVVNEEEGNTQGFINMLYDIDKDCCFISPEKAAFLIDKDVDFINNNLISEDCPDDVSSLDLYNFVLEDDTLNEKDFLFKFANSCSREDFLSCQYEEHSHKDYYIYRFE